MPAQEEPERGESGRVDWAGLTDDGSIRTSHCRFPTTAGLLGDVRDRLRAGRGFAVATLNLDHTVKLRRDAAFRAAYAAHTHITADGTPIVWLERLAGRHAERVTGADLVLPLARLCAREGVPLALLGSTEETLGRAAEVLAAEAPGLDIAACIAPGDRFDPTSPDADRAIDRVVRSGARLCLIALGAPKQEVLAQRARERCPELGVVSIGAGLDYLAGSQSRAPVMVQRLALEWLWRLAMDPQRLARRYAECARILPGLARAALRSRGAAPPGDAG
jgi:exopolysaccharide biosynthesis WecB/TagA/CpsF family protein